MRIVVLDTNIMVSALLVPGSNPARVLRQFRDGEWKLAVSPAILEEYARVLRRGRFELDRGEVQDLLAEIQTRALVVIPSRHFAEIPDDPADNEFLDVAVEAGAEAIVSGDNHLLDLQAFKGVAILTPARFLRL